MGQVISSHLLTAENGVRLRSNPSEIYREKSDTATDFSLSNLGFPVNIIALNLHTYFHFHAALLRMKSGRSLRTFQ